MKTIITASVSHSTAMKLQAVNKGNRSKVVDRAIKDYLDAKKAYTIEDVPSRKLAAVLMSRVKSANNWNDNSLSLALLEYINTLDEVGE